MLSRRLIPCVAACVLAGAAGPAAAAKITVSPGGPLTIQQAVDQANPGDVIQLQKGTYPESVVLDGKQGISIVGKGKPTLVGAGRDNALLIDDCSDIIVSGLVIDDAEFACVLVRDCEDVTLQKLTIDGGDVFGVRCENSDRVTISRVTVTGSGNDGINLGGDEQDGAIPLAPCDDCVVSKAKVSNTTNDGIEIAGSRNLVSKCKLEDIGEDAFAMDADSDGRDNVWEKNKAKDVGRNGFLVGGTATQVLKNKIQGFGDNGIRLRGTGEHIVEKNKIKDGDGLESDGIDMEDGIGPCTVVKNKVSNVTDDGIEVDCTNGRIEKNSVKNAGDNGYQVTPGATGNEFIKNKANNSGDLGLDDRNPDGSNTYTGNKFDSEQFAD